jgi:hypothetical protein
MSYAKNTTLALLLLMSMGCASMRRHPLIYGAIAGGAAGLTYGLLSRQHHCPAVPGYPAGSGDPAPGYGCPTQCVNGECYFKPGGRQ